MNDKSKYNPFLTRPQASSLTSRLLVVLSTNTLLSSPFSPFDMMSLRMVSSNWDHLWRLVWSSWPLIFQNVNLNLIISVGVYFASIRHFHLQFVKVSKHVDTRKSIQETLQHMVRISLETSRLSALHQLTYGRSGSSNWLMLIRLDRTVGPGW